MTVLLKRISQDAELENPTLSSNYLVCQIQETGKEFRVRVSQETVVDLIKEINKQKGEAPAAREEESSVEAPPEGDGGTVFGGDDEPLPDGDADEHNEEPPDEDYSDGPGSEEDVGSL
jgi:hypothetical protein